MKHLLVETSQNPLARELLRSAELDEPPPQSAVRLAVALGLGSSALVSTITTGATATTNATLGTAVATAAKGLTVVGTTAPAAGAAVSANAATSTAVLSSALASANTATGSAVLSSAASLSAASAAAPAVGGALSAVSMLKAMAIVSLTCGALSFGGTKLAMTITEVATPVSSNIQRPQQTSALHAKRTPSRAVANSPSLDQLAAPPPPPQPAVQAEGADEDADEVLPALVQETWRTGAQNDMAAHASPERNIGRQDLREGAALRNASPERNVGRQDLEEGKALRVSDGPAYHQVSLASAELTGVTNDGAARRAAVAAFPSDDEPAAPGLNPQPDKKPKARPKAHSADSDVDLEREVLLLDRARSAVAAGQPLVALQALDAYRTQARRGTLRAESLVLRVRALLALGQRSAAEREAMPFIKATPESRHAARLRELLGVPNDTP